jgi:integrase
MASRKRYPAKGYAGVYYVEIARSGGPGKEKAYYIRYRRQGRLVEEKVGQERQGMTASRAAGIRSARMEGREASNQEKREACLNRLWDLFEQAKSGNRAIRDDRSRYRLHIAPALGAKTVADLTVQDIDRLRAGLEKEGKAPQTVKHVLVLLKRLLGFALRNGHVPSVPGGLHFSMPAVDNRMTENLTRKEARKLLRALDEEKDQNLASLVRLALFTGMRRSALLNLQWADLDFERGFITLRGEAAKNGKTEKIPMNRQARAVLSGITRADSPYVFPGRRAGKPRVNISPLLKRVREKAGLPENFRPLHGLRHSFASWLASSGKVSMFELQKLLTHASPQMTHRYAHLHDDALRKASELAGSLFSEAGAEEGAQSRRAAKGMRESAPCGTSCPQGKDNG